MDRLSSLHSSRRAVDDVRISDLRLSRSPFENPAMVDLVRRQVGATVYVTGVALEYCVRATCLDFLKYGGRPVAVLPLIRAVSRDEAVVQGVEAELTAAGVVCVPQVPPELGGTSSAR